LDLLPYLRDFAIVFLAVESIVLQGILIIYLLQIRKFAKAVGPYVDGLTTSTTRIVGTVENTANSVADTARTTKGTVGFVSDRTAKPVIELYATLAAASRFARALVRGDSQRARDGQEGVQ
jgi:hypothetical protein